MRSSIRARAAGVARVASVLTVALTTVLALALTSGIAAQAATVRAAAAGRAASPGDWPIAVVRHYGSAHDASGYSAVVTVGKTDVWVFGGTNPGGVSAPVAMRWDGTRWQSWPLPAGLTGFISDASAPSSRDIWAVSDSGGYVLHWNGKRWSVARRWPDHDVLTGVTALSPADVWIFGTSTVGVRGLGTWHFNGVSWTLAKGRAVQIYRASAVSAHDIWAVAATRRGGFVEHFDGHAWLRVGTGRALAGASLDDVLALSRHSVWVIGNVPARHGEGQLVVAHFDGRRWTTTPTPWHADTGRLAPDGYGGVWFTADNTVGGTDALIGHLSYLCPFTWTIVRHGLGSGISDIATSRRTGRIWLSGGFLTRVGGDAAIWSHAIDHRPHDAKVWPGVAALANPSWRLDLAALLRRSPPATIA
jgi:hypothetical protein